MALNSNNVRGATWFLFRTAGLVVDTSNPPRGPSHAESWWCPLPTANCPIQWLHHKLRYRSYAKETSLESRATPGAGAGEPPPPPPPPPPVVVLVRPAEDIIVIVIIIVATTLAQPSRFLRRRRMKCSRCRSGRIDRFALRLGGYLMHWHQIVATCSANSNDCTPIWLGSEACAASSCILGTTN